MCVTENRPPPCPWAQTVAALGPASYRAMLLDGTQGVASRVPAGPGVALDGGGQGKMGRLELAE